MTRRKKESERKGVDRKRGERDTACIVFFTGRILEIFRNVEMIFFEFGLMYKVKERQSFNIIHVLLFPFSFSVPS